jgi:Anaphase-promoting complex subunit 11 RING-H2 finger
MYLILLLLFTVIILLLCKGVKFCCDADSEAEHFQVPTAAATTTTTSAAAAATSNPVTLVDPRPSKGANECIQHRTAMGNILIDDNDNNDTDEDEIDLNASTSSANGGGTTSKILSADFGDNNVHPMEETSCSICLINYQHGDRIQRNAFDGYGGVDNSNNNNNNSCNVKDRCDHVFHPECITSWIKTNTGDGECPICRRPFILTSPV